MRYPKANTVNPNVTVFVVNLTVLKFIMPLQVRLPDRVRRDNNSYIGAMHWASKTELSVTVTNRDQTNATTVLCAAPQFHCRIVYVEEMVENTTVLPSDVPFYSSKRRNLNVSVDLALEFGGHLLKRLPVRDGEYGYYRHIVFISATNSRTVPVTMGRYEVTEIVGWHEEAHKVYYMATVEDKPGQRHLFEVSLVLNYTDKSSRIYVTTPTSPNCLTCDNSPATYSLLNQNFTNNSTAKKSNNATDTILLKADLNQPADIPAAPPTKDTAPQKTGKIFLKQPENYNQNKFNFIDSLMKLKLNSNDEDDDDKNLIRNNCLFNKIIFSPNFGYYIQQCLGPERPATFIVDTSTNKKIFVLDSNDQLTDLLRDFALPQVRKMSVELKEGFLAQVRLFLPPGMKDEEEVAFPLILQMDTSPGSQLVSEEFRLDWNWYLSGSQQMIVAQIDARGSGFQGEMITSRILGRLGGSEIEDQLAIVTYLRDTFSYVDRRKICAYGWGYGGYAAAMALIQDTNQVLQCAVAINPISSFMFYSEYL